jgi:inner membrane protein
MDSLTHIVLGSAIGEVTLGKKVGYKAAIIGALADTVPDFDVFLNFLTNDEVLKLQIHRSFTHAFIPQMLYAFPCAYLTHLAFKKKVSYWHWHLLWVLGLTTHSLLDCCTTYGTQYLLPFSHTLVGFNNINVVDIFFTLPFLALVIAFLCMKRDTPRRTKTAWAGLSYAIIYILFTFGNKYYVSRHFEAELKRQNIPSTELSTSPALFQNFLWCAIAQNNDSVWLGQYSDFQKTDEIKWVPFAKNSSLLTNWPDKRSADVLLWFSQGKYFVQQQNDTLRFFNVKWGIADFRQTEAEKAVPFYFELHKEGAQYKTEMRRMDMNKNQIWSALGALWRRAFGLE